jgi:hypothetical protein
MWTTAETLDDVAGALSPSLTDVQFFTSLVADGPRSRPAWITNGLDSIRIPRRPARRACHPPGSQRAFRAPGRPSLRPYTLPVDHRAEIVRGAVGGGHVGFAARCAGRVEGGRPAATLGDPVLEEVMRGGVVVGAEGGGEVGVLAEVERRIEEIRARDRLLESRLEEVVDHGQVVERLQLGMKRPVVADVEGR